MRLLCPCSGRRSQQGARPAAGVPQEGHPALRRVQEAAQGGGRGGGGAAVRAAGGAGVRRADAAAAELRRPRPPRLPLRPPPPTRPRRTPAPRGQPGLPTDEIFLIWTLLWLF